MRQIASFPFGADIDGLRGCRKQKCWRVLLYFVLCVFLVPI